MLRYDCRLIGFYSIRELSEMLKNLTVLLTRSELNMVEINSCEVTV